MEGDLRVAAAKHKGVRWDCVHCEIVGLDSCRIHRVGQVDNEVRRLGADDAVAGRSSGGHGKTHQVSIGVGILLRCAVDGVTPVHPRSDVLGEYRGAVVVVAHIGWLDARIALQRQRTGYIRGRFVSRPGHAVIGRLPGMHLIAKGGGTARLATGRCSRCLVIPRGEEGASFADREVGHPLGLGGLDVGVQLERRTEGHAAVGGTDIKDVAGVTRTGVARGIDEANYVVEGGRLTPAHVPPVSGAGVHRGEEARSATAGARERGARVGVGPGVAAVGGTVDLVGPVGEAATHFVHAGDVHVARDLVAGDLDVADKGSAELSLVGPGETVVSGETDKDALRRRAKSFQEMYIRLAKGEDGLLSAQPDSRSSLPPL